MDDPIADFMAITGCTSEDLAIDFLSRSDFDLGNAVAAYTSTMTENTGGTDHPPETAFTPSPPPTEEEPHGSSVPSYSTRVDHIGGDFNPGVQLGVAPLNPFESGRQETLVALFSYPPYVIRQTSSLETVCARARQVDRWVLLALTDNGFQSACLPRDLWRNPGMAELGENYVAVLEVNVTTGYGERLAHDYRVTGTPLPHLFIVNPETTSRVTEINIDINRIEATVVASQILTFIADNGAPTQYAAAAEAANGSDPEDGGTRDPSAVGFSSSQAVDFDAESAVSTGRTASPLREADSLPASPTGGESPPVESASVDVMVEPVDIGSYTMEGPGAIRLRARLPTTTLTLQLKPDTPVTEVTRYIAYSIHVAAPGTHPVPPSIELRCGFPPVDVTVTDPHVPVSAWPGVRSGDNLMVRIK